MTYAFTDDCTACGACLLTCPEHAIVAGVPLRLRADRCTACGECLEVCPADAVVELPAPRHAGEPAGPARTSSVQGRSRLPDRRGVEHGDAAGDRGGDEPGDSDGAGTR